MYRNNFILHFMVVITNWFLLYQELVPEVPVYVKARAKKLIIVGFTLAVPVCFTPG